MKFVRRWIVVLFMMAFLMTGVTGWEGYAHFFVNTWYHCVTDSQLRGIVAIPTPVTCDICRFTFTMLVFAGVLIGTLQLQSPLGLQQQTLYHCSGSAVGHCICSPHWDYSGKLCIIAMVVLWDNAVAVPFGTTVVNLSLLWWSSGTLQLQSPLGLQW